MRVDTSKGFTAVFSNKGKDKWLLLMGLKRIPAVPGKVCFF